MPLPLQREVPYESGAQHDGRPPAAAPACAHDCTHTAGSGRTRAARPRTTRALTAVDSSLGLRGSGAARLASWGGRPGFSERSPLEQGAETGAGLGGEGWRRPSAPTRCRRGAQSQAPGASAAPASSRAFIAVPARARDVSAPPRPPPPLLSLARCPLWSMEQPRCFPPGRRSLDAWPLWACFGIQRPGVQVCRSASQCTWV
ncbi:uncharacterized protein LOC123586640 [Leopardus geoffroyi]|uniref:uncharacterized protein LOC123586640 n=1 Tax=Leopardus geoffroyi TaxID=46844 RepID=UPI001E26601F|nr:uncharacterized protein LOC123586640 [Leopardus geoffroyi]